MTPVSPPQTTASTSVTLGEATPCQATGGCATAEYAPGAGAETRQTPWWRLTMYSMLALTVGTALTWCLDRLQNERVPGTYDAQPYNLTAGRVAVLTKVLVQPGTVVKRGDPIANLADEALEDRIKIKQAELKTLEFDLSSSREKLAAELQWRQSAIQTEIFQTRLRSTEFLKQRFTSQLEEAAWQNVAFRPKKSSSQGIYDASDILTLLDSSSGSIEDLHIKALLKQGVAQNAEEVASAQIELCDQRIKELEDVAIELPKKLASSLGIDGAQSRIEQAKLELETLERQKNGLTLSATHSGIVGIYRKRTGDRIAANDTIVQILDDSRRFVTLWIDPTRTAEFPIGHVLDLTFADGWSGQGRVSEIEPQVETDAGVQRLAVRLEQAGKTWPKQTFGSVVSVCRKR